MAVISRPYHNWTILCVPWPREWLVAFRASQQQRIQNLKSVQTLLRSLPDRSRQYHYLVPPCSILSLVIPHYMTVVRRFRIQAGVENGICSVHWCICGGIAGVNKSHCASFWFWLCSLPDGKCSVCNGGRVFWRTWVSLVDLVRLSNWMSRVTNDAGTG